MIHTKLILQDFSAALEFTENYLENYLENLELGFWILDLDWLEYHVACRGR